MRSQLLLAVSLAGLIFLGASASVAASAGPAPGCPPPPPSAPPAAQPPPVIAAKPRAAATVLVACIGSTPLVGATFDHWAMIDERGAGKHHLPGRTVVKEVLGFLISSDWVIGEAARLGVNVTEAQVRHHFDDIRHQQFPHRGEFARFLHSSGQTVADLLFRVRLNLLSAGVQSTVVSTAHGEKEGGKLLVEFIRTFKARWQPQTYCAPAFVVADCGHVQPL